MRRASHGMRLVALASEKAKIMSYRLYEAARPEACRCREAFEIWRALNSMARAYYWHAW